MIMFLAKCYSMGRDRTHLSLSYQERERIHRRLTEDKKAFNRYPTKYKLLIRVMVFYIKD